MTYLILTLSLFAGWVVPTQAQGPQASDHPGLSKRFDALKTKKKSGALAVHPHGEQEGIAAAKGKEETPEKGAGALSAETQKYLIQGWIKALGHFEGTKKYVDFIQDPKNLIQFKISAVASRSVGFESAYYEDGNIVFNQDAISGALVELERQGLKGGMALEVLIIKTLPVIAHEIAHAVSRVTALSRDLDYPASLAEEEIAAHAVEFLVYQEIKNKNPLWSKARIEFLDTGYEDVSRSAAKGVSGLEDHVARLYSKSPKIMSIDRAALQADNERLMGIGQKMINKRKNLEKSLAAATTEAEKQALATQLAKMPTEEIILEKIKRYERSAKTVSDPEKFKILQQFYREKVEEANRQLSQRQAQK